MASPRSSNEFAFFDEGGVPCAGPSEWRPGWLEVPVPESRIAEARLAVQGAACELVLRPAGGKLRVMAPWPRRGPGSYHLHLMLADLSLERRVTIEPATIGPDAFRAMLTDLESQLPASIAVGMQRCGGLVGLVLPPPGSLGTLAQELLGLRRAVEGGEGRLGLLQILPGLARGPHLVLAPRQVWVSVERARRPSPADIRCAWYRPGNVGPDGRPARVVDARAQSTPELYENRIVRAYWQAVERRLAWVEQARGTAEASAEARRLRRELAAARRAAAFLDGVSTAPPRTIRPTALLLRHPLYRASLEGLLALQRAPMVRLDAPTLEAPLENLPKLYQSWGSCVVIAALLAAASERGFKVREQRLVQRAHEGLWVRVLPGGTAALLLTKEESGAEVRLFPERTYGRAGGAAAGLRSISFRQRPDVAIEVTAPGRRPEVYVFDPKYKLHGSPRRDGRPKKVDIDRMHAYRDAIRDGEDRTVVEHAAILYPGPTRRFGRGLAAIHSCPGGAVHGTELYRHVRDLFASVL